MQRLSYQRSATPFSGWRSGLTAAIAVCLVLLGSGCDDTAFDPFETSDLRFSIYGYLEAYADTQFIAVTPLRDSLFARTEPLDAVVTLENLTDGTITPWKDSLATFSDGSQGHVFWSTQFIKPGGRYRFVVTAPDGAASHATIDMPPELEHPYFFSGISEFNPIPEAQSITITGVERLADVRMIYEIEYEGDLAPPPHTLTISYLEDVDRFADGNLGVSFNAYQDVLERIAVQECPRALRVEAHVAAGSADWPDFLALDSETLLLPDQNRNVVNGLGYVGGVVQRRFRWPIMVNLFANKQAACRARR